MRTAKRTERLLTNSGAARWPWKDSASLPMKYIRTIYVTRVRCHRTVLSILLTVARIVCLILSQNGTISQQ